MFYELAKMTSPEVAEVAKRGAVAVLPVGAIEQHGPHLPVDTDDYYAIRWAESAARKAGEMGAEVLLMPPLHYGHSMLHWGFAGTISFSVQTLISAILDICDCLMQFGVTKLVVVNGNGGNKAALQCAVVSAKVKAAQRGHEFAVYLADDSNKDLLPESTWSKLGELVEEARIGSFIHGGALETSKLLDGRAEMLRMEKFEEVDAVEPIPRGPGSWLVRERYPLGAAGKPSHATVETGKLIWSTLIDNLAAVICSMAEGGSE
jgi:creatinine amidohydrolase